MYSSTVILLSKEVYRKDWLLSLHVHASAYVHEEGGGGEASDNGMQMLTIGIVGSVSDSVIVELKKGYKSIPDVD